MNEVIAKVDGIDLAISKLDIRSGDLIVLRADISDITLERFRRLLLEKLSLDVHVPGIIALGEDHSIEVVPVKAGDMVVLRGDFSQDQVARFRETLTNKIPGLAGVVALPQESSVEVYGPSMQDTQLQYSEKK